MSIKEINAKMEEALDDGDLNRAGLYALMLEEVESGLELSIAA